MLTNKENEVLKIIKENPTIEQSTIAELLNISRSTVAVHISSLQKKGFLLGKGYIVREDEDYIVGIGAANVDIYGTSAIRIRTHYDHPASIVSSVGGVTFNIICNYVRLAGKAKLISAFGDDSFAQTIRNECLNNYIDIHDSLGVANSSSGIFMQVQDEKNDMYLALCDMSVLDNLTPSFIDSKKDVLLNARAVFFDASLKDETIQRIIDICKDQVFLMADPISDNLAARLIPFAGDLDLIKANRGELETLSGMKIRDIRDGEKACQKLLDKGLKRIAASFGEDGILYMDQQQTIRRKFREEKKMVNASGAGDAMSAALLFAITSGLDIDKTIDYGLAAGIAAIRSEKTINDEMSVELLNKIIEENKK